MHHNDGCADMAAARGGGARRAAASGAPGSGREGAIRECHRSARESAARSKRGGSAVFLRGGAARPARGAVAVVGEQPVLRATVVHGAGVLGHQVADVVPGCVARVHAAGANAVRAQKRSVAHHPAGARIGHGVGARHSASGHPGAQARRQRQRQLLGSGVLSDHGVRGGCGGGADHNGDDDDEDDDATAGEGGGAGDVAAEHVLRQDAREVEQHGDRHGRATEVCDAEQRRHGAVLAGAGAPSLGGNLAAQPVQRRPGHQQLVHFRLCRARPRRPAPAHPQHPRPQPRPRIARASAVHARPIAGTVSALPLHDHGGRSSSRSDGGRHLAHALGGPPHSPVPGRNERLAIGGVSPALFDSPLSPLPSLLSLFFRTSHVCVSFSHTFLIRSLANPFFTLPKALSATYYNKLL